MQRAPGEDRLFRVVYGDGELEFMLQSWFDVASGMGPFDIVVAGLGRPDDRDLATALRAASGVRGLVRDGGALVLAAQLDEDAGESASRQDDVFVIVAASEAPEAVRLAGLRAAVDVEEGLDLAYEHIGRPAHASVLIVPRA